MPSTSNFSWTYPTDGGSSGTWGATLNSMFDQIDTDVDAIKTTADGAMPKSGGTFTGEIEVATERYDTNDNGNVSGSVTFNLNNGNYQIATVTGDITSMSLSNWAVIGKAEFLTLELTNGGSQSITWPGSVSWDGGTTPTLQSSGVDLLIFVTRDNGSTVYGMHAGSF